MNRFLCNTTGSGKTRLLFEGLQRNWGLYFTVRNEPDNIGSSDLAFTLENVEDLLVKLKNDNKATVRPSNREKAAIRFLVLLYARLLVFRIYLDCASALDGKILEKHKGPWLLLQIAPVALLKTDIFNCTIQQLWNSTREFLVPAIAEELISIHDLLSTPRGTLFCVLDGAQEAENKLSDYFLSDAEPKRCWLVLHEIIHAWRDRLPNLIVSGTALSMREMETDTDVAKVKPPKSGTVTDLGGFDTLDSQKAYFSLYLPENCLDPVLMLKAGYWLRGRYVVRF